MMVKERQAASTRPVFALLPPLAAKQSGGGPRRTFSGPVRIKRDGPGARRKDFWILVSAVCEGIHSSSTEDQRFASKSSIEMMV